MSENMLIDESSTQGAEEENEKITEMGRPNISHAWDFFYNMILPRAEKVKNGDAYTYRKLEPGEPGGKLYGIWGTTLSRLGDFGLGVGLYFYMILVMAVLLAIAGLVNAYTIYYFKSDDYNPDGQSVPNVFLEGSAVCSSLVQVCFSADCTIASTPDIDSRDSGYYPLQRDCPLGKTQGILDYTTIWILVLFLVGFSKYQSKQAEMIDVAEQTAQDYSVVVKDPNPDATDPEEWRAFFESHFGPVAYVTVALNNGELLKAIATRRGILEKIIFLTGGENTPECWRVQNLAEPMVRRNPLPWYMSFMHKVGFMRDLNYWHDQLRIQHENIEVLKTIEYHACRIYIVFGTEEAQRDCLTKLTTGLIPASLDISKISDDLKFRGENVLYIEEADEPDEVNWENQHYSVFRRLGEQATTILISVCLIAISGVIIWSFSKTNPALAAIFISISNVFLPAAVKALTLREHHGVESSAQSSLMLKLVIVLWMNTTFTIYIIKSKKDILETDYVKQISSILWADALTSPLVALLDPMGKINHYVFAKLAKKQQTMNYYFMGAKWFLAERYAALCKSVFVTLFFSSLLPQGYYITAAGFVVNYWAAKYCLLRVWKQPFRLNDFLTKLTVAYILLAINIKALVTLQFYAGWPYDGACRTDGTVIDTNGVPGVNIRDPVYSVCNQEPSDIWAVSTGSWMSEEQKYLVELYSVTSIILTVLIGVVYFGRKAAWSIYHLFMGVYTTIGNSQGISFNDVKNIQTYVPQIRTPWLPHPLLATNLTSMDPEHISWTGNHGRHNICSSRDLPSLSAEERNKIFSPCVQYSNNK